MKCDVFKKENHMIGTWISREVLDSISLLALYQHSSKARLLKEIIYKRIQLEDFSLLIHVLAQRAIKEWESRKNRKKADTRHTFPKYVAEVQQSLRTKKISNTAINQILTEMRRIYAENQIK